MFPRTRAISTYTPTRYPTIRYHHLSLRIPARSPVHNADKGRYMTSPEKSRKRERESPQHHRNRREDHLVYTRLKDSNFCAKFVIDHLHSGRALRDINERRTPNSDSELTGGAGIAVIHGLVPICLRNTWRRCILMSIPMLN
jgi:hypothetical protein